VRNIPVLVCGLVILTGCCRESIEEYSETLHEDAVVVNAVYTPPHHDVKLGLTAASMGKSFGMDYGGNLGFQVGNGLQVSSVSVPEKFAVVFKCSHGQFIVTRKDVYEKLKGHEGETVDVSYREVYRATYETKDNERRLIDRVLTDYDFLTVDFKTSGE